MSLTANLDGSATRIPSALTLTLPSLCLSPRSSRSFCLLFLPPCCDGVPVCGGPQQYRRGRETQETDTEVHLCVWCLAKWKHFHCCARLGWMCLFPGFICSAWSENTNLERGNCWVWSTWCMSPGLFRENFGSEKLICFSITSVPACVEHMKTI